MNKKFSKLLAYIKSRIPVSRGRYERELALLKLSVSSSIQEEKDRLKGMIQGLYYAGISSCGINGSREVRAAMRVTDELVYFCRSPYQREALFFHIAEDIAKLLEREMGHK